MSLQEEEMSDSDEESAEEDDKQTDDNYHACSYKCSCSLVSTAIDAWKKGLST